MRLARIGLAALIVAGVWVARAEGVASACSCKGGAKSDPRPPFPIAGESPLQPGERIAGVENIRDWGCPGFFFTRVAIKADAIGFLVEWEGANPGSSWLPAHRDEPASGRPPSGHRAALRYLRWEYPTTGLIVDGPDGVEVAEASHYALVDLGDQGCGSWNIPEELYREGGGVTITAVRPDRSTTVLGKVPIAGEAPPVASILFHGSVDNLAALEIARPEEVRIEPPSRSEARRFAFLASLSSALFVAILGLVVLHRRLGPPHA